MTKAHLARTLAGLTVLLSGTAFAQGWTPGAEVVGQPDWVTTNGITNTVTLSPGGAGDDQHRRRARGQRRAGRPPTGNCA